MNAEMASSNERRGWVRLRTLQMLRWLAVAGQTTAVLISVGFFDLDLPVVYCAAVISALAWFNILTMLAHPANTRLSEREAMLSLLFDLAQLGALLFLTGGLTNPFTLLILAPVSVSGAVLSLHSTVILGTAASALVCALTFWRLPLRFADGAVLELPQIYLFGVWAALLIGVAFTASYARRVTVEGYRMTLALAAARSALAREQQLAAIGGLAAAAAHDLGTPLATIKLVSTEMTRDLAGTDLPERAELRKDAQLIRDQTERCRIILAKLGRSADDAQARSAPVITVIKEAATPCADRGKRIVMRIDGDPTRLDRESQPTILRLPEIVHGLRNLIQNAADFAHGTIWIDIADEEGKLRIVVGDDGPGYAKEVIEHLGEPYLTTRRRAARAHADQSEYEGMGLGLFIAKTLLERSGAKVRFANGAAPANDHAAGEIPVEYAAPPGALAEAVWPRSAVVVKRH